MSRVLIQVLALLALGCGAVRADVEAVTADGRRVLLKDDQTWEHISEPQHPDAVRARLTVTRKETRPRTCTLWLRMTNDLRDTIKSMIPQFSAFTADRVRFETVSVAFLRIKPTKEQYRKIAFSGISCGEIHHVEVHGGDHCEVGKLHKFSPEKGECLKLIDVQRSDLITILKSP